MAGSSSTLLDTATPEDYGSIYQQLTENNVLLEGKVQELLAYVGTIKRDETHQRQELKQREQEVAQWKALHLSATETVRRQESKLQKQRAQLERERNEREEERQRVEEERRRSGEEQKRLKDEVQALGKWQHMCEEEQRRFKDEQKKYGEEKRKLEHDIQVLKDQIGATVKAGDLVERPKTPLNTDLRLNKALKVHKKRN